MTLIKLSPEEATTRIATLKQEYENWFGNPLDDLTLSSILRMYLNDLDRKFRDTYLAINDAIQIKDLLNFLNPSVKEIKDNENDSGGAPRKKGGRPSKTVDSGLGELGATHTDTRPGTDA